MQVSNVSPYSLCEPIIDTTTFVGSSIAFCAMEGISIVAPSGIGALLTAGVNALSITAISKIVKTDQKSSYFLKICTIITALALSTIALPYFIGIVASESSILLTYEMAINLAVIHLINKVALYGFYRIATAFKSYFSNVREQKPIKIEPIIQNKEETPNIVKKVEEIAIPKTSNGFFSVASLKNRVTSTATKINQGIANCSTYAGRVTQNINWKKVGVITAIGLTILVPTVVFFALKPESSNLIPSVNQIQPQISIIDYGPCDPVTETKSLLPSKDNLTLSFFPKYFFTEKVDFTNLIGKNTRATNDDLLKSAEFNLWEWVNSTINKTYILGAAGAAIAVAGVSKCIAKIRNWGLSINAHNSTVQQKTLNFSKLKEKIENSTIKTITIKYQGEDFARISLDSKNFEELIKQVDSTLITAIEKTELNKMIIEKAASFFTNEQGLETYELEKSDPKIQKICLEIFQPYKIDDKVNRRSTKYPKNF